MRSLKLVWALLSSFQLSDPTFAPTSGLEMESATTVQVVAALEAPQVGFEPTTLRLTEGSGQKTASPAGKHLAPTPLLWGSYGSAPIRSGSVATPRTPPRETARAIAHRRGYWSVAPPDPAGADFASVAP